MVGDSVVSNTEPVINGCLNALNVTCRILGLMTEDVETRESGAGHVCVEAYLNDLNKWIFIDGQWGIIPIFNNKPLNALELAECIENKEKIRIETLKQPSSVEGYYNWIKEYLYYFNYTEWIKTENGELIDKVIMLGPVGTKKPEVFQIKYPLQVDVYTNSVADFYSNPINDK